MGSLLGRNRAPTADPFYSAVPGEIDFTQTYTEYGYEYVPTRTMGNMYGGFNNIMPCNYGGLYAQGFNQMPCCSPWSYGNYFLGNTAMQMMPYMYNQMPAMSGFGGYSFGSPSFGMPAAPPMMAAATPLPIAFNPLVQGMYPMASPSPASWMSPSSFMSALSTGPMPYRPPAYDFPSNVGMVMPIPYGTPNPFLSAASSSFTPSYNASNGSWACCCCFCIPASCPPPPPPPPPITYYPRPVSVPQPYPVPCPVPVPVPNVQQVPVPRPVCVVAPPIMADCNSALATPAGAPLWPSQGVFTNAGVGQPMVMSSNNNSTNVISMDKPASGSLPVYNPVNQSSSLSNQPVISSFAHTGSNNYGLSGGTPSTSKNADRLYHTSDTTFDRFHQNKPIISQSSYDIPSSQPRGDPSLPPILHGQLVSDTGWLPKTSRFHAISNIFSGKRKKRRQLYTPETSKSVFESIGNRVSFLPGRRSHYSDSSASEYDCPICQQERDKRRLRKHYGVSTVSSLISSSKESHGHHLSTNESLLSSAAPPQVSTSYKRSSHKSYRRHPIRQKSHSTSPSPKPSNSPILLRRSPIKEQQQQQRQNATIHEVEEDQYEDKKETRTETKSSDQMDTSSENIGQRQSPISLKSEDE